MAYWYWRGKENGRPAFPTADISFKEYLKSNLKNSDTLIRSDNLKTAEKFPGLAVRNHCRSGS